MRQKQITVSAIQEALGLECPQSIYKWLNGTALPSLQNCYLLSFLLDVPMEDMLVAEIEDGKEAMEDSKK
ncbi:MAG: helix-turn-helix domain-containing protein [Lachnospiraceae bacterium]